MYVNNGEKKTGLTVMDYDLNTSARTLQCRAHVLGQRDVRAFPQGIWARSCYKTAHMTQHLVATLRLILCRQWCQNGGIFKDHGDDGEGRKEEEKKEN